MSDRRHPHCRRFPRRRRRHRRRRRRRPYPHRHHHPHHRRSLSEQPLGFKPLFVCSMGVIALSARWTRRDGQSELSPQQRRNTQLAVRARAKLRLAQSYARLRERIQAGSAAP